MGTNRGHLATFKLLPSASGGYSVTFVGSCSLEDRILSICPIDADSGKQATATQQAVTGLREGMKINGVVIAVTPSGCRMFKPAASKGANKSWDDFLCDSATVVKSDRGYSLVGLFGDGMARAYSIPALKEIASVPIDKYFDPRRLGETRISPGGDILGWAGPSEVTMVDVWGVGLSLYDISSLPVSMSCRNLGMGTNLTRRKRDDDILYNPDILMPPRPTISNLQWISGTQYITTSDMDLLSKLLSMAMES